MLYRGHIAHFPFSPLSFLIHAVCSGGHTTQEKLWSCIIVAVQFQLCYHHVEQGLDLAGTEPCLTKT